MVQEALLGVVRRVLTDASRTGLQGEHHFYITFKSQAQGVRLSSRLREKYPEEMTIVLQHQFWDLMVNDHAFEVGLSFGGVPERLLVPFDALTGFYDPSVQFGLKFAADEAQADNDIPDSAGKPAAPAARPGLRAVSPETEQAALLTAKAHPAEAAEATSKKPRGKVKKEAAPDAAEAPPKQDESAEATPPAGAQVVSLDAFRKKK
jgi:uncharacterized protein